MHKQHRPSICLSISSIHLPSAGSNPTALAAWERIGREIGDALRA
jgi:hypothetical protein